MHFYDSHAHLGEEKLYSEIEPLIDRAREAKVDKILNICTCPKTLQRGLELEGKFPEIKNAGATTPHDVAKEGEANFSVFEKAAKAGRLVAIGETGLDYYYKELDPKVQKRFLVRYLHLAKKSNLPVIFHCREAFDDLFAITDREYGRGKKAVLHCFTGTLSDAQKVFSRGWYLSFSGIVTFKKSEELRKIAESAPLDQILIETDAPYLAPQSKRGRKNEPSFVVETARCIADAKGLALEEVAEATFSNAFSLFQKKDFAV